MELVARLRHHFPLFQQKIRQLLAMSPKLNYPSADRNKDPILAVLQATLPADRPLDALEISSGTGQHIAHFAPHFPLVVWRGSEMTQQLLDSIRAHQQDLGLDNTLDPWLVDVTTPPEQWPQLAGCDLRLPQFDLIINVNMMHIAPFEAAQGISFPPLYKQCPQ